LKPIKAKELIVSTALELNLPVDVVETIVFTYWKDVRIALSELKNPIIHISNFGDFTFKHWLLDKEIDKTKKFIDSLDNSFNEQILKKSYSDKLELLYKIKGELEKENERKSFIKNHKKILKNVKRNIQK